MKARRGRPGRDRSGLRPRPAPALLAALAVLAGCVRGDAGGGPARRTLHVFAASSLAEAFRDMEGPFEERHPDLDVVLSFAGSQVLGLQIAQGAPAGAFASADLGLLDSLARAEVVSGVQAFAGNELAVVVPKGNPAGIASFADLPRARRIVLATAATPAGAYARRALERADAEFGPGFRDAVMGRVASEEHNVRLVRAKVQAGEADAAIVYRTDGIAAGLPTVPVPSVLNASPQYGIGVVVGAPDPAAGQRWVAFARSAEGRRILAARGFLTDAGAGRAARDPGSSP